MASTVLEPLSSEALAPDSAQGRAPPLGRAKDGTAPAPRIQVRTPPPSSALLGHVPELRRDPLGMLLAWNRDYGDVVRVKVRHWSYILYHPDDVKHVLVSHQSRYHKGDVLQLGHRVFGQGLLASEEPLHLSQRHLMQPAFHREALQSYGSTMVERAFRAAEGWGAEREVDISAEMMRLTLGIAAKTLFGLDDVAETQALAEAVDTAQKWIFLRQNSALRLPDWVPSPLNHRYRGSVDVMDRLVYRIIHERRKAPPGELDLLTMLLQARDEHGAGMADEQLRDEALTLLLAGHETTANGLSWTLYLLAQHPEVLGRLEEELSTVLQGRAPQVADLPRLRYTDMVFAEAIRLYPPAWLVPRECIEEDVLETGSTIPVGAQVVVSPWATQRSPRYFPEPDRFDPERFAPGGKEGRPPFAYFPFGAGTRRCIGEPFAKMEAVLILAALIPRIRFALVPGQQVVPDPLVTLRPRNGIRMRVARRKRASGAA